MEKPKELSRFLGGTFESRHLKKLFRKMKACYLVDYENVHQTGLSGLQQLPENTVVCLFYGHSTDSVPLDIVRWIGTKKRTFLLFKVEVGQKNSLDFQLVSFLGFLIAKHQSLHIKTAYYIITKDNGFQGTADFWRRLGISVHIQDRIILPEDIPMPAKTVTLLSHTVSDEFLPLADFLCSSLNEKDKTDKILQLAKSCRDKVVFRHLLVHEYGEDFAVQWYQTLKKYLPYRNLKSKPQV